MAFGGPGATVPFAWLVIQPVLMSGVIDFVILQNTVLAH